MQFPVSYQCNPIQSGCSEPLSFPSFGSCARSCVCPRPRRCLFLFYLSCLQRSRGRTKSRRVEVKNKGFFYRAQAPFKLGGCMRSFIIKFDKEDFKLRMNAIQARTIGTERNRNGTLIKTKQQTIETINRNKQRNQKKS